MLRRIVDLVVLSVALGFGLGIANAQTLRLDYSSYLGGSADERGYAIASDSAGAIYVAGFTQSSDFPLLKPYQPYYRGGTGDLFVAKFNRDGSAAYLTYIGGSGGEGDLAGYVGGIAVDSDGNAYVTGVTRSDDFPTTPDALQPNIGSQWACDEDESAGWCGDAFVLKLSAAGNRLLYSTFLGGSDYDDAKAIAIDRSGAAYITGMTTSSDFPTTDGALQRVLRDLDAYVAKISPDGTKLLYSTLLGGTGADAGMAIAVDSSGRAYVGGTTEAADFPVKNGLQTVFGDPWDAFVACVNADGSDLVFSTLLGGKGTEQAFGIALDANGDIYIVGSTDSEDFPVRNAFQPQFGGGDTNGFVTKMRGDGSAIVYSTFLGGADGRTMLNAITVDVAGHAFVAGQGGADFPVVNSVGLYGGGTDAVVAKLMPDGSGLLYSTFLGGSGSDAISGIALDPSGKLLVTGQTSSADFNTTGDAFQRILSGPSDAFVVRLAEVAVASPTFSSAKLLSVGNVYVEKVSSPQSLIVLNLGGKPLTITSIVTSSNVEATTDCTSIAPGVNCWITARLSAPNAGDQSGSIAVYDNAPDSPQTIFVRGSGVYGGDLGLSSLVTSSSFSYYGKTAVPFTATIANLGPYDSQDVVLRVHSSGGAANCDPCYVGSIKAGASAVARFNFIPAGYGSIAVTVEAQATEATPDLNASNNLRTVNVLNPHYAVSTSQLTFDREIVNFLSEPQPIIFTSLDGQPLQLSFSTSGDFTATSQCSQNAQVCSANVVFQPTSGGFRTGVLVATEAVGETQQQIALSGWGIAAPHVRLSTTALAFVEGVNNTMGTSRSVQITNDGGAPLILAATIAGAFVLLNQCPPALLPGETCSLAVNFGAVRAGVSKGTLVLHHNAPNLIDTVNLTGIGIPPISLERPTRQFAPDAAPAPSFAGLTSSQLQRPLRTITNTIPIIVVPSSVPDRVHRPKRKRRLCVR